MLHAKSHIVGNLPADQYYFSNKCSCWYEYQGSGKTCLSVWCTYIQIYVHVLHHKYISMTSECCQQKQNPSPCPPQSAQDPLKPSTLSRRIRKNHVWKQVVCNMPTRTRKNVGNCNYKTRMMRLWTHGCMEKGLTEHLQQRYLVRMCFVSCHTVFPMWVNSSCQQFRLAGIRTRLTTWPTGLGQEIDAFFSQERGKTPSSFCLKCLQGHLQQNFAKIWLK